MLWANAEDTLCATAEDSREPEMLWASAEETLWAIAEDTSWAFAEEARE